MRLTGLPHLRLEKTWWEYAHELGASVGIPVPRWELKWARYKVDDDECVAVEFQHDGHFYGVIYRLSDLKLALIGPFETAEDADNPKPEHVLATAYMKQRPE